MKMDEFWCHVRLFYHRMKCYYILVLGQEFQYFVGIDEVGRGPVAGPVFVCALMVKASKIDEIVENAGLPLRDSKKLTEKMREKWFEKIKEFKTKGFLKYAVVSAAAGEIDKKGISVCIKACCEAATLKLKPEKDETKIFLDGGLKISGDFVQETIIKGDENIPVISLASIVAKVLRDREMKKLSADYPGYFLEKNKGYGTKDHLEAVKKYGLTEFHRRSFLKRFL
jgi:ribonuclease HII